ncbi:MAG TPA: type II secretion system F family protein [Acidimicrobiia bacterium]|nr:type II secretion system F family protein [Acidimicrobiia bacterium]
MRYRAVAIGVGLVAITALPASAGSGELEIVAVDVADRPAVSIVVALPGEVVAASPDATDFAVVVNGSRVESDVYALVRDPIELVIVMDTSGSMEGQPLARARAAALDFAAGLPESVRLAVVSFGDRSVALTPMGAAPNEVTAALSGLSASGETALYDAVIQATGLFSGADARRVIVVLSDGGDTASRSNLEDAVAAIAESGAEVRAVALQTGESDAAALHTLAPGGVITADDGDALAAAYGEVASELTGRYRLRFVTFVGGEVEVNVYVNGPNGVLAASRLVDLTRGTATAGRPAPPPPPGFGPPPEPVFVSAAPERLAEEWALPAGIALVFAGALVTLWLMLRSDKEGDDDDFVPMEAMAPVPSGRRGLLSRAGVRARAIGDAVARRGKAGAIDIALDRAGLAIRPGEFVVVSATGVVVGVTMGLVLAGLPGALLFGGVAAALPRTVLRTLAARRRRAFADQLQGTLQTIAGSLRAGYGLVQAISTVAAESPAPTSVEFERVVVENRVGRSIEDSLRAMARRLDDEDFVWVVEAIEIQREVGGNLAEVLDTVTGTIRDRNMIRRQIHALSAEGRLSAYILIGLPFVIAGLIATISPDYLSELTDSTIGRIMLGAAAALMFAGSMWIRKIVRVEF